ncbi:MAG: hypothetical protein LIO86_01710 [Lachnospiraceae bacterium]|nr:hypothetical protein [Lachnospiraceae bacterium]MCD8361537.1 hypothetical protein [Lachnospiraceae bacterium]
MAQEEKKREAERPEESGTQKEKELSPTWNEDCLTELDDWIESQGVYLRQ